MHDVELLRSFAVLNRTFLSFFSAALAGRKLSYSEGVMVVNIGYRPGTTQDAIALDLVIDKAAVARSVKSLKKRRLVRAKQSKEDKRSNSLFLTASGEAVLRFIDELNRTWIESVTSHLTATERRVFFKVLGGLVIRARRLPETLLQLKE